MTDDDHATSDEQRLPPSPELDVAKYLPDLAELDVTEAQKIELLHVLWSIMRSCVDLGIDVGVVDTCGQVCARFNAAATCGPDSIKSPSSPTAEKTKKNRKGS